MVRAFVLPCISALLSTALTMYVLEVSTAQVMQSSNYQIQSDSLNVGGNDTGSSTNYNLLSTIGETGTGVSDSESYTLGAGYRQMQEIYIALTGATNVSMSPAIPGVSGGDANGSTTVTVTTDSSSGYALTLVSENAPAMQKGAETIADYNPVGNPTLNFAANNGEAFFGFTPEGAHIVSLFKDNGSLCGTGGSLDTIDSCWDGVSTSPQTIASYTNSNHPDGTTTTIKFRASVGAQVNLEPGYYIATTTVTALPL